VKEVNFAPGRESQFQERSIIKANSLSSAMLNASKDVDKCAARPFIFGLLKVQSPNIGPVDSMLQVMYDFDKHQQYLQSIKPDETDKEAPLPQCVLIHRALAKNVLTYQTPLVPLKSFRPLLELVQPLEEKEAENL